jgi:hypothetical protein
VSDPYRTPAVLPRPRLSFGDPRRGPWAIVGGLALIAVTIAMLLLWSSSGGRFNGSIALPAIFGALMILRARWGAMELQRDRDVLAITRQGLGPTKRQDVPLSDVQSVEIVPLSYHRRNPDHALNLTLTEGRKVMLLRARTMASLEPDRQAIAAFLVEHRLLWGGKTPEPKVRVEEEEVAGEGAEQATDAEREAGDAGSTGSGS